MDYVGLSSEPLLSAHIEVLGGCVAYWFEDVFLGLSLWIFSGLFLWTFMSILQKKKM